VLSYLHAQHPPVIFRDLKPANVMLTPEGQLKLIDFGIARLFKPGQSHDTQAFGTMGYSAPEQYGRGQTDARSDVYSLGVMLHQLLTGFDPAAAPFRLPPANQVNSAIPADVAAALARATNNDPEQRFASVAELDQALLGSSDLVQRTAPPQLAPSSASGPAATYGAGPASAAAPPQRSTTLARVALWMGAISLGAMALATILVGIGAATQGKGGALSTIGILLALLPFFTGPAATIVGIVALTRPQIRATANGRRDAVVGIVSGVITLLLCCVLAALLPNSSSEGATIRAAAAYNPLWSQIDTFG
jgi:serine/threonine-protein kinase